MSDQSLLIFSANGSGVVLRTKYSGKYGGLCFTTSEFKLYQRLFRVADNKNQGKLQRGSTELNTLLIRTDLEWDKVDKICTIAVSCIVFGKEEEENTTDLDINRWLVVCKCIAYSQKHGRIPDKEAFKKLHGEVQDLALVPFANFNLDKAQQLFQGGKYGKAFRSEIVSWKFYEHVKFKINNTSATAIEWNKQGNEALQPAPVPPTTGSASKGGGGGGSTGNNGKKKKGQSTANTVAPPSLETENGSSSSSSSGGGGGKSSRTKESNEIERRYSEFEVLVHILQRHHMGFVIPPLPIKSWPFFSTETQHEMRRIELQLFLNDITKHPVLKYSFELKSFLESSSQGYKEFRELYAHLNIDGVNGFGAGGAAETNSAGTFSKLISDGAAAVVTGANAVVANHRSLEVIQSIWGYVTQTVSSLISPHTLNIPNENAELFARTSKYLESIAVTGVKLEAIIALEKSYVADLAGLGLAFKNMSEIENVPMLVRLFRLVNHHLDRISAAGTASLLTQSIQAQLPLQYAGKFSESYHLTLAQRAASVDVLQAANRNMYDAEVNERKAAEIVQAVNAGEEVPSLQDDNGTAAEYVKKGAAVASSVASAAAASTAAAMRSMASSVAEVASGVQHISLDNNNSSSTGTVGGSFSKDIRSTSFELIDAPEDYEGEEASAGTFGSTVSTDSSTGEGKGDEGRAPAYGEGSRRSGSNSTSGWANTTQMAKAMAALNSAKQEVCHTEELYESAKSHLENLSAVMKAESSRASATSTSHATVSDTFHTKTKKKLKAKSTILYSTLFLCYINTF